jgi:hypothetical protein
MQSLGIYGFKPPTTDKEKGLKNGGDKSKRDKRPI